MSVLSDSRRHSLLDLFQRTNTQDQPNASSTPAKLKAIDQLLENVGSFGRYQKIQFFLVGLLAVVPAMTAFSYVFIAATPDHRCQVNLTNDTDSFDKWTPVHEQFLSNNIKERRCFIYEITSQGKQLKKCSNWVFNQTYYGTTISTDWNLVCDQLHLKGITQNAYIIGTSGSLLSGIMSDKFGRRTTMFWLILLLAVVFNFTQLFMHSNMSSMNKLIIFTLSRLLTGFAQTTYSISLVLLLEMTSAKRRVLASNILSYFYTLGELLIMGIYYFTRDWAMTMWILTVYVMPFLFYYCCVPESARWLATTRQLRQARKVLERIGLINGRELNNVDRNKRLFDALERETRIPQKRYSYTNVLISLFQSSVMRRRCLIIFYIMMTNLMVYLGIGMGITSLTSNWPYEIFLYSIFAELVGVCLCQFCATKFDRKYPLIIFFLLCSLSIVIIPTVHDIGRDHLFSIAAALFAKLFISAAQGLSWIYTSETFPTTIRSTGVGLTVGIARIGGVWAPQISLLAQSVWFPLPYIIFSFATFIAAICALFLPETRTKPALPDTVQQAERSGEPIDDTELKIRTKKLSICPEIEEEEEEETSLKDHSIA